jgi:RimJ/RimL family protein N-acetyltransferase
MVRVVVQIARFDDYCLRLLLPWHEPAVAGLQPGDLAAASGEWICRRGDEGGYIRRSLIALAEGRGFRSGIWKGAELCGVIGLNDIGDRSAGISYALDARHRGQGIATRACRSLIAYALDELKLARIGITVDCANGPSRAVAERLGFTLTRTLPGFWQSESGPRDAVAYVLDHERPDGRA